MKENEKNRVFCELCGKPIPAKRLEFLPDTTTCVNCSQTQPYSEMEILGAQIKEPGGLSIDDEYEDYESDNYSYDDD